MNAVIANSSSTSWLYIAGCVALPLVWGLLTEFIFRRLGVRRKEHQDSGDGHLFVDYQI